MNRKDQHLQGEKKGLTGERGAGPKPGAWHPGIPQVGTRLQCGRKGAPGPVAGEGRQGGFTVSLAGKRLGFLHLISS